MELSGKPTQERSLNKEPGQLHITEAVKANVSLQPKAARFSLFKLLVRLSAQFLFNKKMLSEGSFVFAFVGLVLGVSALVASMSVMRGFEFSLKQAMVEVTSDLQVLKKGRLIESWSEFSKQIKNADPAVEKVARFAYTEAVLAAQGKVAGVLVQGLDWQEAQGVINLSSRLRQGQLQITSEQVLIGQGLAKKFNLKIGDQVYLAVSLSSPFEEQAFKRNTQAFKVFGILDFGKHDWNERLILTVLKDFQLLTQIGERYTGAFVKLKNSDLAVSVSQKMNQELGPRYVIMNWYDVNKNLFEAVKIESVVIFFVVFLIVVMASFNISSTLYILIRQRYKEIAILKSIGASQKFIQAIFVFQGVLVAFLGSFLGYIGGFILSLGFMWLQSKYTIISGSVYKIDRINAVVSFSDFLIILFATLVACLAATYPPARRGSRMQVVEGLKLNE